MRTATQRKRAKTRLAYSGTAYPEWPDIPHEFDWTNPQHVWGTFTVIDTVSDNYGTFSCIERGGRRWAIKDTGVSPEDCAYSRTKAGYCSYWPDKAFSPRKPYEN